MRIVENRRPRAGPDAWHVAQSPEVRIGGIDADGLAALYRVSDAAKLPNGDIVVANVGSSELRIFGSAGQPRTAIGRHGDGPGEFRDLYHLEVLPDGSILTFDGLLARATIFVEGEVESVTTYRVPGAGYVFFRGRLSDGRLLVYHVNAILDAADLPEHVPVISSILGDKGGRLWVEAATWTADAPSLWSVFDSVGQWLTDVTLPRGGRVFEIGEDYILGVWRDELDVEQVRVYELIRRN